MDEITTDEITTDEITTDEITTDEITTDEITTDARRIQLGHNAEYIPKNLHYEKYLEIRHHDTKLHDTKLHDTKLHDTKLHDTKLHDTKLHDTKLHDTNPKVTDNLSLIGLNLEALFLLRVKSAYELSKELAPHSKIKYNYLMLDSNNLYEEHSNQYVWLINDGNPIYKTGYVNLTSKLRNITAMRLGRTTFAHMNDSINNAILARDRIGFGFNEFTSQALLAPANINFHFLQSLSESDVTFGTTSVVSSFYQNRGWFRFRQSFKHLDRLTLKLWNMFSMTPIKLPLVPFSIPAIQHIGPSILTGLTNPLTLPYPITIASYKTNLPMYHYPIVTPLDTYQGYIAEAVSISGFTTDDPISDAALIAAYNGTYTLNQYHTVWFESPIDISGGTYLTATKPITITLLYRPRFTTVLELISEDDDDIPIH